MSRFYISAAHKSSGKTTVSLGLCHLLYRRGFQVQPFKKGPDYIDPLWMSLASHRACYNLDFNTQTPEEIRQLWHRHASVSDCALLEGNKGLFDGVDTGGSDSNAALASLLGIPVILVVDVEGITRGIAPLLLGYQAFDPGIRITGVILNKVVGRRHEKKLRAAMERYTDLPVLGTVPRDSGLVIEERHLGLVPGNEHAEVQSKIGYIGQVMEEHIDIDEIIGRLGIVKSPHGRAADYVPETDIRIGVARDSSFGFYYQDDLESFSEHGAELVDVDLINDKVLPDIDGLFIGGGFPEVNMKQLAANRSMLDSVRTSIEQGLPVYAECGGLMYLCRKICWHDDCCTMAEALPADVVMHERPQGRGLVRLRETGEGLWRISHNKNEIHAHEFHHSSLENIDSNVRYGYEITRGRGIDGSHDGIIYRNVMAGYSHLRSCSASPWVSGFSDFVRQCKLSGKQVAND